MAKRKVSNLLALAVLSLLTERPMHPYEMSAVIRQRELSAVIKLNQSSLYAVIEALSREGWIVPIEMKNQPGRFLVLNLGSWGAKWKKYGRKQIPL